MIQRWQRMIRSLPVLPDEGCVEILGHLLPQERSEAMERVGFAADQLTPEGLAHDIRVLERG